MFISGCEEPLFSKGVEIGESFDVGGGDKTDSFFEKSYSFSAVELISKKFYSNVLVPGLDNRYRKGEPIIPFKTIRVLLPHGPEIDSIDVILGEEIKLEGDYFLEPGQEEYPYIFNGTINETPPNKSIYNSLNNYPKKIYSVEPVQRLVGYDILTINLYPVRYVPKTKQISYFNDITVKIKTKGINEKITNGIAKEKNYRELDKDMNRIRNIVENPEIIETYEFIDKSPVKDNYDYIIITNNELKPYFAPFVAHKQNTGLSVETFIVDDILNNPEFFCDGGWGDGCGSSGDLFNDPPARLRNFIKFAYNEYGVEYVLLGGDDEIVPVRYLFDFLYSRYPDIYSDIPSDIYYTSLDGNWDDNEDGFYGEDYYVGGEDPILIDEADLYSELFVGRIPVETHIELTNWINKQLDYETSVISESNYLKNMLLLGETLDSRTDGGDAKDLVGDMAPAYSVKTKYDRDESEDYDSFSVIHEINSDRNYLINHNGHANYGSVMGIHYNNVDQIYNENPFFAYSEGCLPSAFDEPMSGEDEAIGEILISGDNGAFSFIGNTRFGWYSPGSTDGPGDRYDGSFFDAFVNEDINELGKALQDSKEDLIGDGFNKWEHFSLNLFGDPSVKIISKFSSPSANLFFPNPSEMSTTYLLIGTAKRGDLAGSTFSNYEITYGYGVEPTEWLSDGIYLSDGGTVEKDNGILGSFDSYYAREGTITLKLTVYDENGGVGEDYYVTRVNNHYISSPENNDFYRAGDIIPIMGTAQGTLFESYVIEYGKGIEPESWILIEESEDEVYNGVLGYFDTGVISENDYYTIRLRVQNVRGYESFQEVHVVFDPDYLEGWPQKVDYRLVSPTVGVADVDNDGYKEIISGETRITDYSGGKDIFVWNHDGSNLENWPVEDIAYELIISPPVVTDVDGDDYLDIFLGVDYSRFIGLDYLGNSLYEDGYLYFDNRINRIVHGDVDNNGNSEFVFFVNKVCGGDSCSPNKIYLIDYNGDVVPGWPFLDFDAYYTGIALADLIGDGFLEIVLTGFYGDDDIGFINILDYEGNSVSGWPVVTEKFIYNSPMIADINGDGSLEIITCSDNLYVYNYDGSLLESFDLETTIHCDFNSLAVGDINGDSYLEIVLFGHFIDGGEYFSKLFAFNHDGSIVDGWPVSIYGDGDATTPILGDIDGDVQSEILFVSGIFEPGPRSFFAFNHDGSIVDGWPKYVPNKGNLQGWRSHDFSSPVISDVDSDGDVDVILGKENYLLIWDLDAPYYPERMEWPMFQHDSDYTGNYNYKSCGDGITQSPNIFGLDEECDDGNRINTDACTNQCSPAIAHDGICWEHRERCGECCDLQGGNCFPCDDCVGYSGSIANCDADEICTGFNPTNLNNQPRCTKSCSSNFPAGCFYIECPQEYDEITGYEADITDPLATACSTLDPNQQPHEETWVCCALPT